MRLLIIEPGFKLWGSERALLATIPAIIKHNEKVVLVAPSDAEIFDPLKDLDIKTVAADIGNLHKGSILSKFKAFHQLWKICDQYNIQKVYLNQAGLCKIVSLLCRLKKIPLVIHVRIREDIPRVAALKQSSESSICSIQISDDMAKQYDTEHSRYDPKGPGYVTAYDPFLINKHEPVLFPEDNASQIVCVGRLAEIKGQINLIEGLSCYLKDRESNIVIDFLGDGVDGDPYVETLSKRVKALGLEHHTNFLGYRLDVPKRLKTYKFLIAPSLYEPLGRVVMEAWEAGVLPIASSSCGGAAEIIRKSGAGILYDGHDSVEISAALEKALNLDEKVRSEKVLLGQLWAKKNLNLETYQSKLQNILFH